MSKNVKGKLIITDANIGSFRVGDGEIGEDKSFSTRWHCRGGDAGEVVPNGEKGGARRKNSVVRELFHSKNRG